MLTPLINKPIDGKRAFAILLVFVTGFSTQRDSERTIAPIRMPTSDGAKRGMQSSCNYSQRERASSKYPNSWDVAKPLS